MMRAFVCIGAAIILAFIAIGIYAEHCRECCNGEPCNPALRIGDERTATSDPANPKEES